LIKKTTIDAGRADEAMGSLNLQGAALEDGPPCGTGIPGELLLDPLVFFLQVDHLQLAAHDHLFKLL
jgi:hypothetical protein